MTLTMYLGFCGTSNNLRNPVIRHAWNSGRREIRILPSMENEAENPLLAAFRKPRQAFQRLLRRAVGGVDCDRDWRRFSDPQHERDPRAATCNPRFEGMLRAVEVTHLSDELLKHESLQVEDGVLDALGAEVSGHSAVSEMPAFAMSPQDK